MSKGAAVSLGRAARLMMAGWNGMSNVQGRDYKSRSCCPFDDAGWNGMSNVEFRTSKGAAVSLGDSRFNNVRPVATVTSTF